MSVEGPERSVALPSIAAKATLALNAAEWFRRGRRIGNSLLVGGASPSGATFFTYPTCLDSPDHLYYCGAYPKVGGSKTMKECSPGRACQNAGQRCSIPRRLPFKRARLWRSNRTKAIKISRRPCVKLRPTQMTFILTQSRQAARTLDQDRKVTSKPVNITTSADQKALANSLFVAKRFRSNSRSSGARPRGLAWIQVSKCHVCRHQ